MYNSDKDFTNHINYSNVKSVRDQILKKQNPDPYHATVSEGTNVLTDMDHFPYTRFYRGNPESTEPTVFEREAGWRPLRNECYEVNRIDIPEKYPQHCWESACKVVYPCSSEHSKKWCDREDLNSHLNNSCIVQYR